MEDGLLRSAIVGFGSGAFAVIVVYLVLWLFNGVYFLFNGVSFLKAYSKKQRVGISRLHRAMEKDDELSLTMMLEEEASIKARDTQGRTPLHYAAKSGKHKNIGVLILFGKAGKADIDARDTTGQTPLHKAVWFDNPDSVVALVANGADIKARDNSDQTPLDLARIKSRDDLMNLLLTTEVKTEKK